MLIPREVSAKMPLLINWLDWNFYAYRTSLCVFIAIFILHCFYQARFKYLLGPQQVSFGQIACAIFVGFCAWCVYIAIDQGYGVG